MPPRHRQEVIRQIYEGLNTGGGFIFAEKTVCQDARLQNMMTFNYYDYKRQNFDTEDIMDKEKTLRHMMKPNTWNEIIDNLCEAGFGVIRYNFLEKPHIRRSNSNQMIKTLVMINGAEIIGSL